MIFLVSVLFTFYSSNPYIALGNITIVNILHFVTVVDNSDEINTKHYKDLLTHLSNESYLEYFSFIRYLNVARNIVDRNQ